MQKQQPQFSPTFTLNQQKLLAIMEFLHNYDEDVSLNSMLNGYSFYKILIMTQRNLIEKHTDPLILQSLKQFTFHCQIRPSATSWDLRLLNYLNILNRIEEYVWKFYKFQKKVKLDDIDLVDLCKFEDEGQLIRMFELVMSLLIDSFNKDEYIQRIMELQESSQQHFVELIKNALENRLVETPDVLISLNQSSQTTDLSKSICFKIIQQFQADMKSIQNQNMTLSLTNNELQSQLAQTLEQIDLSYKKSTILDSSYDDAGKIIYLEEKIKKLKDRLIVNQRQYQSEKQNLMHQLSILQNERDKLNELEQLCEFYKEKYESIMDEVKVISIWKKEKVKFEKIIEEKEFVINKMQERIQDIQEKNSLLEERELETKLTMQSKNVMIQKMEDEVRQLREKFGEDDDMRRSRNKSKGRRTGGRGLTLFGINSSQAINQKENQGNQDDTKKTSIALHSYMSKSSQIESLKRQNEEFRQKIKKLQKQMKKSEYRSEKMKIIEEEKKKLQGLIYELTMCQNQEIKLLTSVMYESFVEKVEERGPIFRNGKSRSKVKKTSILELDED